MTASDPLRVALYVRSLAAGQAHSRQEAAIERLHDLEAAGTVDETRVYVWGREAPATPAAARTEVGLYALNRVAVFSAWARQNGLSVDGHFQRETVDSSVLGETHRVVRFPIMTLAEYRGDDLRFVAPASDRDRQLTVHGRLEALAADAVATDDADGVETAETSDFVPLDHAYVDPPAAMGVGPAEDRSRV